MTLATSTPGSDLDEFAIAALQSAPVDSYGVGTSLVTGSGAPTASMVYKLVSRTNDSGEFISVAKAAKNKASVGGRKYALRKLNEHGRATQEVVGIGEVLPGWTGPEGVIRAKERHAATMAELPAVVNRLQRGEAAIPTIYEEN
jgi:nicotinate phosphoribosyltransferase